MSRETGRQRRRVRVVAGTRRRAIRAALALTSAIALPGAPEVWAGPGARPLAVARVEEGGEAPASIEDAQAAYAAGVEAREAGDHTAAASEFFAAYRLLPEEPRERRAAVLFDLIAARRRAFEERGDAAQLCASERVLDDYLAAREAAGLAEERDTKKARELAALVRSDLDEQRKADPALDCLERRVEGEAPPDEQERVAAARATQARECAPDSALDRRLVIGGAVSLGIGAVALAVMIGGVAVGERARADRDELIEGEPLLLAGDPRLDQLADRHRVGDGLAIAGGLVAGAALGVGVTMLVLGTRERGRRMALAPYLTRGGGGAAFRLRF